MGRQQRLLWVLGISDSVREEDVYGRDVASLGD
jgi:hypothetical protein